MTKKKEDQKEDKDPEEKKEENKYDKYLFYCKTIKSGAIRTLIETIKDLLIDVNFFVDQNGFRILNVDKTETAFVHLKLEANSFNEYYCLKPFNLGVVTLNLFKLMKIVNNSDILSLYITLDDDQKLCIVTENAEKKNIIKSTLNLIDANSDVVNIPPINFESIFQIPGQEFQKHCRDLTQIDEYVDFFIHPNEQGFTMCAEGEFGKLSANIGCTDIDEIDNIEKSGIHVGRFELKFLNLFCKSAGLAPSMIIYLKKNNPILLNINVADIGSIKFALASKHI